jgi:hypothetical protein
MSPAEELAVLGRFYGTAVDKVIARFGPALDRYAEWVLGRDQFAFVTLGDVPTLASYGDTTSAQRFACTATHFSGSITGIKFDPAEHEEPTLYVRTTCPWQIGARWLERALHVDVSRILPARTLYGLGFQGNLVKTYALTPEGFVSHRLDELEVRREHKDYRAEIPWDGIAWPDARWAQVGALGSMLGFERADHVGWSSATGATKLYVERVGAIATDRSLA